MLSLNIDLFHLLQEGMSKLWDPETLVGTMVAEKKFSAFSALFLFIQ